MTEKAKTGPGEPLNRRHKATMFSLLFGEAERAKEVYEAITDTTLGPNAKVKMTTIPNVLSGGKFNDLSFEVDDKLVVLIEHQSTLSENMPLRMLFYITKLYSQRISEESIYAEKMIRVPLPEFIVLYIGTDEMPNDTMEFNLSDAFMGAAKTGKPPMELTVKMHNINKGRNVEMAKRSPTLDGYETFIAMVRENAKTMSPKEAVKKAVDDCIKQGILKDFFLTYKKELVDMLVTEWDYDLERKVLRKEAVEEERLKTARILKGKGVSVNDIAEATGLTVDEILRL